MYFEKERDEFNSKLAKKNKTDANADVVLAIKFVKTMKYLKLALAAALISSYFILPDVVLEILICGMLFSLILPQGFMDTYLERLIQLRAAETDERQMLNAAEANRYFDRAFRKIQRLEAKCKN